MLRSLDIHDMGLIDRLNLPVGPGLTVLTGETGAGKSILLDALGFALGWKGRADIVRPGAEKGEVTAVFALPSGHPARALLDEAGFDPDDDLILRRTAHADGRRQAFVNDRRAGADLIRALADTLVELHGQHDDRGLMDARGHRAILDQFAGLGPALSDLRRLWAARGQARAALAEAEAALDRARAEEDWLRHAAGELTKLDPQPGEEAALDTRRRQLQGGARLREALARALADLGPQGAEGQMSDAQRRLTQVAGAAEGALDPALAALDQTREALSDAVAALEQAERTLDLDPAALERVEERLFALRAAARKYGRAADDLGDLTAELAGRLAALDASSAGLAPLQKVVVEADRAYGVAAKEITARRTVAAGELATAVAGELAPLKMDRARFAVDVGTADPGPDGQDGVTFTVATGPGLPVGALNRIASGGELSRFLLALKVCLTMPGAGRTMIFDEIDRGVGGATADAVGRRLARLADGAQVIVVTHSPQVAAQAAAQWRVDKDLSGPAALSRVSALSPLERVDEIARMLAGDQITDAARAAARALLDAA